MMKKIAKFIVPISIVIVHRNSSSTILYTLEGIKEQDYPIKEVIIVDNHSTDDSLGKIKKFSANNKSLHVRILAKNSNTGVGNSYNMGVKASKSNHIILMQADGVLPSKKEISLIMRPALEKNDISASTSFTVMPKKVWNKYNFWEKCMFCPALEKDLRAFTGKFSYINKKLYLKAGGFDEKNFNPDVGGEDTDLTIRLKKVGKMVETNARVIHLHYLGKNYSLKSWILNRKLLARSYGKIMRMHKHNLSLQSMLLVIKPCLALFSFALFLFPYNFLPIIAFALIYMRAMYTTKETLTDPRIVLLPFVSIALIYYETFWMLEQFF
jgi:glycosyltransferase involved in cell wall biosynthesis